MNEFILLTYIISLIALATSIYAIIEVRSNKEEPRRKNIVKRVENQPVRPKGHWD